MSELRKMYYSISEVCKMTGLEPHVLRYWEGEFPQLRPKKNRAGNRAYREKDIEIVQYIKHLLYEEQFTIPGAKKKIAEGKIPEKLPEPAEVPSQEQPPPTAQSHEQEPVQQPPTPPPTEEPVQAKIVKEVVEQQSLPFMQVVKEPAKSNIDTKALTEELKEVRKLLEELK